MARLATLADAATCFSNIWQQQLTALRATVPGEVRDGSLAEFQKIITEPNTDIFISNSNKAYFFVKYAESADLVLELIGSFPRRTVATILCEAIFRTDTNATEFRATARELFL